MQVRPTGTYLVSCISTLLEEQALKKLPHDPEETGTTIGSHYKEQHRDLGLG